jgi:uncharacterized protein (TIGR00725 family)
MKGTKRYQIGVIGPAGPEEYKAGKKPAKKVYKMSERVGKLLAEAGAIVVTGGKSGVMESAARGAKERGGLTVGVVKGAQRFTSNAFTDIEVVSGMAADGFDEFLVVAMCDALIVLGGGAGTLEEIVIAYRNKKPIIAIEGTGGWAKKVAGTFLDERKRVRVQTARDADDAVRKVLRSLRSRTK